MKPFLHRFYRAVIRVFPSCLTQTQAVAFNMFLAFFPMLLLVLGVAVGSDPFQQAFRGMIVRLRPVLPPGSLTILNSFVSGQSFHPWRWILLGLGGTVVIAHGASTARAVTSACLLAADLARGEITEKITQRLGPGRSASRGGHFLRRPLRC